MRRKTSQALALRARIVLACAEGIDSKTVATKQRVTSNWLRVFVFENTRAHSDASPRVISGVTCGEKRPTPPWCMVFSSG
jgi:hypothetical protein